MLPTITYNLCILLLLFPISFAAKRSNLRPTSSESLPVVYPGSQRQPSSQRNIEALLMKTAGLKNVSAILAILGVEEEKENDDDILSRRKSTNFADVAVCEPEMRTVEVANETEAGLLFYPKCVRVLRCGGCCHIDTMTCTPTKITKRIVKQAQVRVHREISSKATHSTVEVDVHEECRCMCKVKEEDCHPVLHTYERDSCKCSCNNSSEESTCRSAGSEKYWDNRECKCKCRNVRHCHSGTEFSHESCSCELS